MNIKRYEAPTLQDALQLVKKDIGSDAIILYTKKIPKRGFLGLFNSEAVEVLASEKMSVTPEKSNLKTQKKPENSDSFQKEFIGIKEEIKEMKDTLKLILKKGTNGDDLNPYPPYPPIFGEIYLKLIDAGIENQTAQKIISSLESIMPKGSEKDSNAVKQYLKRTLMSMIRISGQIELKEKFRKVIALVGPTGVGKTTTAAKLAAKFSLNDSKKVGFIAADNYRIAASEQLKIYGDILQVPVKVIYDAKDLKQAIDQFVDMDLVIIDTAGRSPNDKEKMKELNELLSYSLPLEIYLLISSTTSYSEVVSCLEKFKELSFNYLIFTKLDEANNYSIILNTLSNFNLSLSYLTTGQDVPGNIEVADPEKIVNLILGE